VRPARELQFVAVGASILLYDGEQLRLLTDTAARIWRLLDGATDPSDIVLRVSAAHPGDAAVLADTQAFLAHLLADGLLTYVESGDVSTFRVPPAVAYVADGAQTLLVHLEDGTRRALSPTGTRVWELAVGGRDVPNIVVALHAEFPDAPTTIDLEVSSLLQGLTAAGLLVRRA
jgi:hypothetical protein